MRLPPARFVLGAAPVLLITLLAPALSARALASPQNSRANERLVLPTPEPPILSPAERMRLAFAGFDPGVPEVNSIFPGRMVDQDFADWPPMRILGDSAYIAGKTFTVQEVRLVAGEAYPIVYEPATGYRRPAPGGLRTNLFDFSKNTGVFIPPNTTLVMVRVEVEPEAVEPPPGVAGCLSSNERDYAGILRVSYPGLGESRVLLTDRDENLGEYRSPRIYCLSSGWLYFHVGSAELETNSLWFEIVDDEFRFNVAIWTLITSPSE